MQASLLATKLYIPPSQDTLVARSRLTSMLTRSLSQGFTLVSAPAGYGKTTLGGNAFDERINKFNRSMNRGYRLSRWFVKEFGSTQCQALTGCDFSSAEGVRKYIESNQVALCNPVARRVAEKVQMDRPGM